MAAPLPPAGPPHAANAGLNRVTPPSALPSGRQSVPGGVNLPDTAPAERVPFDWRQAKLRREGSSWKLAVGAYTLADFGTNERAARLGEQAMHHYRFNEHCLVGRPETAFSYFLVNGQAPRGVLFGVHGVPFRPETLRVQQAGPECVIGDGHQTLLRLACAEDEAKQLVQAIQRHRFDHLCRVGQPGGEGMTFFTRGR
jgi:hypothetical protein